MARHKDNESLLAVLDDINRRYIDKGIKTYTGIDLPATQFLSSGNILIDAMLLGGYGIPRGILVELLGNEGSGKSRLCKQIIASAQQSFPDRYAAIVPAERADYTREGLLAANINPERLLLVHGGCAEDSFQVLLDLLWNKEKGMPRNQISAWAVDSLPALVPNAEEIVEDLKDSPVQAPHATLFHRVFRTISVKQSDAIGILVNQTRDARAARPGMPAVRNPFGGKAVKHWPKLILELTKFGAEESGKDFDKQWDSFQIAVRSIKNNIPGIGSVGSQIYYRVYLRSRESGRPTGIDQTECLIRAGIQLGLIQKSGGWLTLELDGKTLKENGETRFANALEDSGEASEFSNTVLQAARVLNDSKRFVNDNFVVDKRTGELLMESEADDAPVEKLENIFLPDVEEVTP